jgi:DeoR family transcriptional regulator, glycerol-3-phosphate regulon repressor
MLAARHQEILRLLKSSGKVSVDGLAQQFNISPQTIRKDLNELCDTHILTRVHGGAILSSRVENVEYAARQTIASKQKFLIGKAVAEILPDNASLFVNIGTTTEAVARALTHHKGLMIITNNINVANALRPHEANQVIIAGGVVRPSDGGIVGEAAVDFINQFKVDFAIMGVSAIDADGGLFDYDYREVKVAQAIMANARHVILVAESSKHERTAPVRIGHISQINTFVTDKCPSDDFLQLMDEFGLSLIETDISVSD